MRAYDDEIAVGVLRGPDDSLGGMLILDVGSPASCTRLVGSPFRVLEDGGRVPGRGLLISLHHGGVDMVALAPSVHGSVTVTTVTWIANALASARPWAKAFALA